MMGWSCGCTFPGSMDVLIDPVVSFETSGFPTFLRGGYNVHLCSFDDDWLFSLKQAGRDPLRTEKKSWVLTVGLSGISRGTMAH